MDYNWIIYQIMYYELNAIDEPAFCISNLYEYGFSRTSTLYLKGPEGSIAKASKGEAVL